MHAFRYEIFVRRLGWSLPLIDGEERDQFDNENAVYFLSRDGANITACARILPTTVPYMLPEVFPHLLGGNPAPKDPGIWELSRLATSTRSTGQGRVLSFSRSTLALLETVLDYARENHVRRVVLVITPAIERLLLRAMFDVHRLGAPARSADGGLIVAAYLEVPSIAKS